MILVFHHCGLFIISNMEFLFFLGNQLVTRKYTYQIIFTRCSNHPEIFIPLYSPKHIICPQLVIISQKVIIHSQKCSFTHIRCHLFYSFSSKWASSKFQCQGMSYQFDQTDIFMFWLSGVSYVICHSSFMLSFIY